MTRKSNGRVAYGPNVSPREENDSAILPPDRPRGTGSLPSSRGDMGLKNLNHGRRCLRRQMADVSPN